MKGDRPGGSEIRDADVAGFAYVGMPNRKSADDGARGIPRNILEQYGWRAE